MTAEIPLSMELQPAQTLVATDRVAGKSVSVQVLMALWNEGSSSLITMFPLGAGANGTEGIVGFKKILTLQNILLFSCKKRYFLPRLTLRNKEQATSLETDVV